MLADKVLEALPSSFSGIGSYILNGAVGAYRTFRSDFADGEPVRIIATNQNGTVWEIVDVVMTWGTPDSLTGRTLKKSSTGSLINWQATDAPVYVYPGTSNDIFRIVAGGVQVNGVANVPSWLQKGQSWLDYVLGIGTAWIKKRYISGTRTTAANHAEEGRLHLGLDSGATHIFTPSPRRMWVDKSTSAYTATADDIGVALKFNVTSANRALTLPKGSDVGHGFALHFLGYGSSSNGVVLTPNAADAIDAGSAGATLTVPGNGTAAGYTIHWDGAQWRTTYVSVPLIPGGRRQTVQSGPAGTDGTPSLFPASASGLTLNSQNVSGTSPLIVHAGNGGPVAGGDRIGQSTGNLAWSLTNSTTNYPMLRVNSDGTLTPVVLTLLPIIQQGGTPSTTNGQYTYNIGEGRGYLGNGATAVQDWLVPVGEAVTSGGNITGVTPYAYNGHYESAWTNTLPAQSSSTSFNHNLGQNPKTFNLVAECITTDSPFQVGDQVTTQSGLTTATSVNNIPTMTSTRTNALLAAGNNANTWQVITKSGGSFTTLTFANWKYKLIADRGW